MKLTIFGELTHRVSLKDDLVCGLSFNRFQVLKEPLISDKESSEIRPPLD